MKITIGIEKYGVTIGKNQYWTQLYRMYCIQGHHNNRAISKMLTLDEAVESLMSTSNYSSVACLCCRN